MVSLYGAVTVANLEAFVFKDYSAIDAGLTDTVIETLGINPAEVFYYGYSGTAPSSTSSNPVKYGIMEIARLIMEKWMQGEGINPHNKQELFKMIIENMDISVYFGAPKPVYNNERSLWIENG